MFDECVTHLVPELPARVTVEDARGTSERWGSLPRTFVRCTNDRALVIALQNRMIREADEATPNNPFEVHTLPAGHSPFASMPQELSEILAAPNDSTTLTPGKGVDDLEVVSGSVMADMGRLFGRSSGSGLLPQQIRAELATQDVLFLEEGLTGAVLTADTCTSLAHRAAEATAREVLLAREPHWAAAAAPDSTRRSAGEGGCPPEHPRDRQDH